VVEEILLAALSRTDRFQVVGRSDLAAYLTLEQQRQAAGCSASECMVQLAGALGVEMVASADIAQLGNLMVLNLRVVRVRDVSAVRAERTVHSDDEILAASDALAREVAAALDGGAPAVQSVAVFATPPSATGLPEPAPRLAPSRDFVWNQANILTIGGEAMLGLGGVSTQWVAGALLAFSGDIVVFPSGENSHALDLEIGAGYDRGQLQVDFLSPQTGAALPGETEMATFQSVYAQPGLALRFRRSSTLQLSVAAGLRIGYGWTSGTSAGGTLIGIPAVLRLALKATTAPFGISLEGGVMVTRSVVTSYRYTGGDPPESAVTPVWEVLPLIGVRLGLY
jgi:TolB-like protein